MKARPGQPPPRPKESWFSGMGGAQRYFSIGLQAGMSVVFYLLLGLLLDRLFGTFPWLMLVGILLGIAGMFALFLRVARELNEASEKKKQQEKLGETVKEKT